MELEINKNSFLKEFTDVHNMGNRTIKKRSDGFMYLHNMITKKLAEGSKFTIGNLDFSQFTYDDMNDYIAYYNEYLEPKVRTANQLFRIFQEAESVFSTAKRFC